MCSICLFLGQCDVVASAAGRERRGALWIAAACMGFLGMLCSSSHIGDCSGNKGKVRSPSRSDSSLSDMFSALPNVGSEN